CPLKMMDIIFVEPEETDQTVQMRRLLEQQLPPGISESGEVVDMAVYEAWQREQNPDIQQKMQRREEVNINVHRERGEDVEPGDDF
ncbi:hypothetical protein RNQ38_23755, partial [Escherichia coli]|nr:hypothetical protein [Escherichia coli]